MELYERHRIVVDPGQEPERLDKFLQMRLSGVSRNKIQSAADTNCILVNDSVAKSSYKVKPGDTIVVLLPYPPHNEELVPQNLPLDIVYEDPYLVVVNKQPGMVVHPAPGNYTGTLLNGLLYHLSGTSGTSGLSGTSGDSAPVAPSPQPYLVHRIDKDTSGLMLVAKTEEAQAFLAKQFFDHTIERKYQALVWGNLDDDDGTIEGNLERLASDRRVVHVTPDPDRGKHAVTHWHVLERFGYVTLVECVLETGRTHQIRAHMRHIGHPLFNDAAYGGDTILKGTTFSKYRQFVDNCFSLCPRQALHARVLGFVHPATGETLHFEQELPADMAALLEKWRAYTAASSRPE